MRLRIEEVTHKLQTPVVDVEDSTVRRSPSPEPVYDTNGKRTNTREQRVKNKLTKERVSLINEAVKINPTFKPPADYKPIQQKKRKKLFIPVKDYPEYNFIGLIIGPRGTTQKQMEQQTGTKIAVRGKGSMKDGRSNAGDGSEEELHVLITADTDEQLEKASKLIEKLLVPVDEDKNEHKRQQLRKLAELNGTLRDSADWETSSFRSSPSHEVSVSCANCGSLSHPTSDCPLKGEQASKQKQLIDEQYLRFLLEIGDNPSDPSASHTF